VDNAALTNLIELQPERILQHRHFVKLIQAGVEHGFLPAGGTPGSLGGLNKKLMPHVPKRAWVRGKQSNSIPRTTQHAFMYWFVDNYGSRMRHKSRCLDWDGWYGGSVFASVCREVDVVEYGQPFGRVPSKALHWTSDPPRKADRWYRVDVHSMADHLEHGVYDLVIANSVFEHFRQPFRAMQQIVLLMRSGGYSDLLWAPLPVDDIFTFESAGRCEVPAACPCHHTNQPLTRGMRTRAEILIFRPRLDKLSARCSGPSKPSHISIARRRRCVEPWGPLRASHVCSLSRASHPPGSSLSRCRWRSTSLHSARLEGEPRELPTKTLKIQCLKCACTRDLPFKVVNAKAARHIRLGVVQRARTPHPPTGTSILT